MLLQTGCNQEHAVGTDDKPQGEVIAKVGEQSFYVADIDHEILIMPESMRHVMTGPVARAKVLDVMLKRAAVAQKARDMGLNLDPVIAYKMRQAENAVLIDSVRQWQSAHFNKPSIEDITAYYQTHQAAFAIPEQIHARHILVRNQQQALDILKQLKQQPQRFASLVAQYSIDDGNKARGGDLNWFGRGVMVDAFEKVAFKLHAGKRLSQPVKSAFGWHIIEWLGKRDSHMPSLAEVRAEIVSILNKQHMDAWVNALMEQADIEVLQAEYRIPQL
ncbi:MAG: peptidylprolyl isomerase [Mariprofundaceae bacterium]|nr:peptidylprolyl isomerase [Mariprofundaceae bacterium]